MQISLTNPTQQPLTVKKVLTQQGVSHRLYHKLKQIPANFVVNHRRVPADYLVNPQATVCFELPTENNPDLTASFQPLNCVYEDDHWLVVDKPVGLSSVPGPSNRIDTLTNRVKGYWLQQGSENLVPHIITRLDRDTQGLVLIAKHLLANSWAQQQLAQQQIKKYYYARVAGQLSTSHGLLDQPIGRQGQQIARQIMAEGQPALTEYWVLQTQADDTLVKVQLHTGRTHQIRVHFAATGHPLLGDQLYGGPVSSTYPHQALEAYYLSFFDPIIQKPLTFTLPLRI